VIRSFQTSARRKNYRSDKNVQYNNRTGARLRPRREEDAHEDFKAHYLEICFFEVLAGQVI
jgi:hypothetical protein